MTSPGSQILRDVQDLRNHPAASLLEAGVAITISPDDPGPLGYDGVSYDWWEVGVPSSPSLCPAQHHPLPTQYTP